MENSAVLNYDQVDEALKIIITKSNDNILLNKASQILQDFSKNVASIPIFIRHIEENNNRSCKQLAAVLLSKNIDKFYEELNNDEKLIINDKLINLLLKEKTPLILKSIAFSVVKILKFEIMCKDLDGHLFKFIFTDPMKYSSDQINLFETNLYIISEILELIENIDSSLLNGIKILIYTSLENGTEKMKENATKCLTNLIRNYDIEKISELNEFKQIIPLIIKCMERDNFEDSTINHIFQTLCDFNIKSISFFEGHFSDLVILTYTFLLNDKFQILTKMILAEFIELIAECKKNVFTNNKNQLLLKGIEIAFKLNTEEVDQLEIESNEISLFDIGNRLLGIFSYNIKSSILYPIIMNHIGQCINDKNEYVRRSCYSTIGIIAEGCEEKFRDNLDKIVDLLVSSFIKESSISCKHQIIISIDRLTEYFDDLMAYYHDKIVPLLIEQIKLDDKKQSILNESALIELNYFIKILEEELEIYHSTLIPLLLNIIFNVSDKKNNRQRSEALSALCTLINRAPIELFNNHSDIMNLINNCTVILKESKMDESEIKGNSLRCIGEIYGKLHKLIGINSDNEIVLEHLKIAYSFANSDDYTLIESGFCFFGLVSRFVNLDNEIEQLVNIGFKVLKDDSGIVNKSVKQDKNDEYSDDDNKNEDVNQVINSDFINSKNATLLALTQLFKASAIRLNSQNFNGQLNNTVFKYFEEMINILDEIWETIDVTVDIEIIGVYASLVSTTFLLSKEMARELWIQHCFFNYENIIKETPDKLVVIKILEEISNLINEMGSEIALNSQGHTTNHIERILNITIEICNKKLNCQVKNDDEDQDEEDEDTDEKLLNTATDIYLILSEKLQENFHPYFSNIVGVLYKMLNPKKSEYERNIVFGIFAEVFNNCSISCNLFCEKVYTLIESNLKKIDKNIDDTFRTITFLLGVMYAKAPQNTFLINNLEKSIFIIQYSYEKSESMGKDNSIAAACRILTGLKLGPDNKFFEILLGSISANLPMKNDIVENISALEVLIHIDQYIDISNPVYSKFVLAVFETLKYLATRKTAEINQLNQVKNIKSIKSCLTQIKSVNLLTEYLNSLDSNIKTLILDFINM